MELTTPWFDMVIKIQEIETLITYENKKIADLEKKKEEIDGEFSKVSEKLLELENELKSFLIRKKENENALVETEDEIKKHQTQLNQARKQEVYNALIIEIENAKKKKDEIETEIITLIDEIEKKNTEISLMKKEFEEKQKVKKEKDKKVENKIAKIKNKIEFLEKEKKELIETIDDTNLKRRIIELLKNKNSLAVVKAKTIENHSKLDYYCSGCNMKLNANDVNSIKKLNTFVVCQNCLRLIYI